MVNKKAAAGVAIASSIGVAVAVFSQKDKLFPPEEPTQPTPEPTPDPEPEPDPTVIQSFNQTVFSGLAPLTVGFSITVADPESKVLWDFGDGKTAKNTFFENHTYFTPKTYNGSVKVTRKDGKSQTLPFVVTVLASEQPPDDPSDPPTAQIISNFFVDPVTGPLPLDVGISLALGQPVNSVTVDWDDGTAIKDITNNLNASHIYQKEGTFSGKVTAVSKDNDTESRNFTIVVGADPTAPMGEIIVTDKSESTYSFFANFQGQGLKYAWDFGDGKTGSGQETSHTYTKIGTFLVTVVVTDQNGAKSSDTVEVSVRETDLQAEFGDVDLARLTNTIFDHSWNITNVVEKFLNLEYTLRLFDQNGFQVDSRIREFGLDPFTSNRVDYNLPSSVPSGELTLVIEVQDFNTKQLVATDTIRFTSDSEPPQDEEPQQAQRGSIVVRSFSLSQVDSRTVRAILEVGNNNNFAVDGKLMLFPEWINPDGSIINLEDQVKDARLEANEIDRIFFQWQPLFGFELQPSGSKLRVGANYQDLHGNFLVSGQPTKQITV